MNRTFDWYSCILISLRLTPTFFVGLFFKFIPIKLRFLFIFVLSFCITINLPNKPDYQQPAALLALTSEFANGVILSFGFLFINMAIEYAGQMLDLHTGFNMASIYNPQLQVHQSLFTQFFNLNLVFLLMSSGIYSKLLGLLCSSFQELALGEFWANCEPKLFARYLTQSLKLGIMAVSPLVLLLLFTEFFCNFSAKNLMGFNYQSLLQPVKIILALVFIFLLLSQFPIFNNKAFSLCNNFWRAIYE